ncbi:MAG TPA: CAP domain-containing protein [Polyangiaceae bacterium]|nr:CAP domain-containing protein [Polyangiaceae bacterium]
MRCGVLLVSLGLALGCSGTDDGDAGNAGGSSGNNTAGTGNNAAGSGNNAAGTGNNTAGSGNNTAGSGTGSDMYADARTRCVDRVNELRASKGKGPIPRLASAEACADGQAKSDSESGKAHGAFNDCADQVKHWSGIAQNECPGYKSVEATLTGCIDMMWAEGPGGGHYENMMGGSTHMACGFYTTPDGKVWQVQDYWTE